MQKGRAGNLIAVLRVYYAGPVECWICWHCPYILWPVTICTLQIRMCVVLCGPGSVTDYQSMGTRLLIEAMQAGSHLFYPVKQC